MKLQVRGQAEDLEYVYVPMPIVPVLQNIKIQVQIIVHPYQQWKLPKRPHKGCTSQMKVEYGGDKKYLVHFLQSEIQWSLTALGNNFELFVTTFL